MLRAYGNYYFRISSLHLSYSCSVLEGNRTEAEPPLGDATVISVPREH